MISLDVITNRTKTCSNECLFLSCIVLLGLSLRLWGITWGFPRIDLNPDELNVLKVSSRLTLKDLNPHFFSYSGFTFYLNYFSTHLLTKFNFNMDPVQHLLVHRLWSVFWGTLIIILCYWSAQELTDNKRTGYISAALMAIVPLHVWDSHLGTTDIGLTFWTTFAFLLSIKAYKKPSIKNYFLGGLLVGFAMGVKFNGALAAVSFLTAAILTFLERRTSWQKAGHFLILAFLGAAIASFISSPYSFIDYHHTIGAFSNEFRHSTGAGHFGFDLQAKGWQYHPYLYQLSAAFPFSLGLFLWIAALIGIIFFVFKYNSKMKLLVLTFPVLYFLIVASWKFVPIRYYLPMIPILIIITAYFFNQLLEKSPRWGAVFFSVVFAYTFIFSVTTTYRFSHDTRIEAAAWVARSLKPGSQVFLVDPHFGFSYAPFIDSRIFQPFQISLRDMGSRIKEHSLPDRSIFCLSSLDYGRYYRKMDDQTGLQVWESIRNQPESFQKIKSFQSEFINKSLYSRLDPMFEGYFVSPTIEFYQYHFKGNQKMMPFSPS